MNVSKASCGVIAIAGAALAQLTGAVPASAQSAPATGAATVFFSPSVAGSASTTKDADDRQVITQIEDGTSATITIVDGEVESAQVDGKDIPTDRVRVRKDRYEILDADGDVVATIQRVASTTPAATFIATPRTPHAVSAPLVQTRMRRGQAAAALAPTAPVPPAPPTPTPAPSMLTYARAVGAAEDMAPPKVMIGVNLSEPDSSLLGHFGLKPGEVTMFSGVYQGLPAGSAGIGVYDIVLRVNGKSPAGPEDVRKVLRTLNPGDNIQLTILQHGQQKDVTVKVEPYSSDRLSQAQVESVNVVADAFGSTQQWRVAGGHADEEQMRRIMVEAELAAAAGGGGGQNRYMGLVAPEPGRPAADPSMVPLIRLEELRARERDQAQAAADAAVRAEILAKTLTDRAAQMEKRSDRNADLEKRLDRLERMLEKLLEEKTKDRP